MAVNRREISDERRQHRRTFTGKRDRDVSPGEPAAAEELMYQDAH
jgi:hypothetical protein